MSAAKCSSCGQEFYPSFATQRKCFDCINGSTHMDEQLDNLIQAASTPNLASLFRKAKDSGLLPAVQQYQSE